MQPSLAYRYKVLAWNGSLSPDSNTTLATTIVFDDPVLVRNLTPIRAIHVVQLRQAVDSVRHAAGLSPGTYTDAALCQTLTSQHQCVGPVAVKHGHVQDLRDQLQNALVLLQIPQPTYSDSPLTQGVIIKKQHIEELRAVVGTPSQ